MTGENWVKVKKGGFYHWYDPGSNLSSCGRVSKDGISESGIFRPREDSRDLEFCILCVDHHSRVEETPKFVCSHCGQEGPAPAGYRIAYLVTALKPNRGEKRVTIACWFDKKENAENYVQRMAGKFFTELRVESFWIRSAPGCGLDWRSNVHEVGEDGMDE